MQQDRLGPAGWKALQCALAGRKASCIPGYITKNVDQVTSPHSAPEAIHNCVQSGESLDKNDVTYDVTY